MFQKYLKGIGMMVGLIFGAGIFALPYVIYEAGFFWGLICFFVSLFVILIMHLSYADIAYNTAGKHRFTGYVKQFLGEKANFFALFIVVVSYYGSLLVYMVLGGVFLAMLFGGFSPFFYSLAFFIFGAVLIFLKLDKIALVNFYLSAPILLFVVYLFYSSFGQIDLNNFYFWGHKMANMGWFLPYGVWIFSLSGFAAVPETGDIFGKSSAGSLKSFKKAIIYSILIAAVLYWIFVFTVVGTSGVKTSPDALVGMLESGVGNAVLKTVALMGFLAMFTSFLVLAADLKAIYSFDFNVSKLLSWFLVCAPPVVLFILGFDDFTKILGIIGTLTFGFMGLLIILMVKKWRGRVKFAEILSGLAIFLAVGYELWNMLF